MNYKVSEEYKFNTFNDFQDFLQEILRLSDKEMTILSAANFILYYDADLQQHRVCYMHKKDSKALCKIQSQIINSIENKRNIRMIRIEDLDEVRCFNQKHVDTAIKVYETINYIDNTKIVCIVGHQDEEKILLHLHVVYTSDSGPDLKQLLTVETERKDNHEKD